VDTSGAVAAMPRLSRQATISGRRPSPSAYYVTYKESEITTMRVQKALKDAGFGNIGPTPEVKDGNNRMWFTVPPFETLWLDQPPPHIVDNYYVD
jgi:hypothetical protein